ncbi:hypothetical protein ACE1TI_03285 [Alteribacillus sp. JSM 102045]|uniref:hypothetical protein n=1 Tax=Alteribacillus sp. JSM 102045 TaxID=1562101 RepID=UPI0035C05934
MIENEEKVVALGGSDNFTRRNLKNYNLDASVLVVGTKETPALKDAQVFFDRIWFNKDTLYTFPYDARKNAFFWLKFIYYLQKLTNTSTY